MSRSQCSLSVSGALDVSVCVHLCARVYMFMRAWKCVRVCEHVAYTSVCICACLHVCVHVSVPLSVCT